MTVIQPNSISGVTSITAQGGGINFYRADGTGGDLTINNIVGAAATFTGVLTYEDVANVDSVGVITARTDINLGDSIIHVGDTNTKIRFPAADTISAETAGSERVRIDSSGRVLIGTTTEGHGDADNLTIADSANSGITIRSGTSNSGHIYFSDGTSGADEYKGIIVYEQSSNYMGFWTNGDSEKLRIDSSGRLLLGTTTEGASGADQFTVASSSHGGITIRSGSTSNGNLMFSDGTSGAAEYAGYIQYEHDNDKLNIGSNGSTRLSITSVGDIDYKYNDSDTATQIGATQVPHGLRINNQNNTLGRLSGIHFAHGLAGTANAGIFHETTNTASASTACLGDLTFWTKPNGSSYMTERLRIKSDGETVVNGDSNPCLSVDRGSANTTNINIKYNGSTRAQLSAASNGFEISAVGSTAPIQLYTNGTEKVQINASGNDGFLKIADNNTSSAGNHGFRFGAWGIQMRNTNGYDHWYIRRNNGGWQGPQITFKGNGHTGVNRTDPAETLDVDGGARFRSYVYIGDGFFFKSNAFGGNTNADTGISINQGGRGGCSLLLVSRNYNAGTGTSAGIYRIKWYYDGNNAPNTHHMSGDNFISFGVSGSNTLTVNGGGGNQIYGIIHITG